MFVKYVHICQYVDNVFKKISDIVNETKLIMSALEISENFKDLIGKLLSYLDLDKINHQVHATKFQIISSQLYFDSINKIL